MGEKRRILNLDNMQTDRRNKYKVFILYKHENLSKTLSSPVL